MLLLEKSSCGVFPAHISSSVPTVKSLEWAWLPGYFSSSCVRQSSAQLTRPNLFRVWRYPVIQIYCTDKETWKAQMGQIRTAAKSLGFSQNWFEFAVFCFVVFFWRWCRVFLTSVSSFRKAFRSFWCSSEPIPSNQNKSWMLLFTGSNCIHRISSFLMSSICPLTEATFINLSFHCYWWTGYYANASSLCLHISCSVNLVDSHNLKLS